MKPEINELNKDIPNDIEVSSYTEMGKNTLRFMYGNCIAVVGSGVLTDKGHDKNWATVYSLVPGADEQETCFLLSSLKAYFEEHGYDFAFSFAETAVLKGLLYRLKIKERETGTGSTYNL